MTQVIQDELTQLIEPTVISLGCELWGIEYLPHGKTGLLRIYIDKPEGIVIDDCERVSRQVSAILDVHDPIQGQYHLEISSPGMPRPLFFLSQYERFIGESITVRLMHPIDGRKNFKGIIKAVDGDVIDVTLENETVSLLFTNITKAHLNT